MVRIVKFLVRMISEHLLKAIFLMFEIETVGLCLIWKLKWGGGGSLPLCPLSGCAPVCVRLFTSKTKKKKQTLKYLVDCTLNSKFNVRLVTGKSARCLNLVRNRMCRSYENNRFPPPSKFPTTDWWWLDLFSRRFCSSNNYYCFFWSFAMRNGCRKWRDRFNLGRIFGTAGRLREV